MWGWATPAPNTIPYWGRGLGDELQWLPPKTDDAMVRGMRCFYLFLEGFSTWSFFRWVRGNVVSYILFLLTSRWTAKENFIWRCLKKALNWEPSVATRHGGVVSAQRRCPSRLHGDCLLQDQPVSGSNQKRAGSLAQSPTLGLGFWWLGLTGLLCQVSGRWYVGLMWAGWLRRKWRHFRVFKFHGPRKKM